MICDISLWRKTEFGTLRKHTDRLVHDTVQSVGMHYARGTLQWTFMYICIYIAVDMTCFHLIPLSAHTHTNYLTLSDSRIVNQVMQSVRLG